jgi:hypothetical protein
MENPITIETPRAGAAENVITAACLGSCSILNRVTVEQRLQILQNCAETTQVFCGGPRQGQKGPLCGQASEAAKSTMMQQVRATRV